jgi:hypothetical protein
MSVSDVELKAIVLEALGSDELPTSEIAAQLAADAEAQAIPAAVWRGREHQVTTRLLFDLQAQGQVISRRGNNGGSLWRVAASV